MLRPFVLVIIALIATESAVSAQNAANANVNFRLINNATKCHLYEEKCFLSILIRNPDEIENLRIDYMSSPIVEQIASGPEICTLNSTKPSCLSAFEGYVDKRFVRLTYHLKPLLMGRKKISIFLQKNGNGSKTSIVTHQIRITEPDGILERAYIIFLGVQGILLLLCMAVSIDSEALLQIVKMPVAVFIGFVCQYGIMPLLAYSVCLLFKLSPEQSLAMFIYGCSPGGMFSNNWTILFNGDINLSVIMTFISTLSSLFMMPAWLFTLGLTFTEKNKELEIPFKNLMMNLFAIVVPLLLGIPLGRTFPKIKQTVVRIVKPLSMIMVITVVVFTLIAQRHVLPMLTLKHWLVGPIIPWSGFLVAAFFAWITRRPTKQIFTIMIETGLQNIGVPLLIVTLNFPSPESSFAMYPLMSTAFFSTLPLFFILLIKTRLDKRNGSNNKSENDTDDAEVDEKKKNYSDKDASLAKKEQKEPLKIYKA